MIDLLVRLGRIKAEDRESILASLKQREETMSTGIGFGIAIPHASSDRIDQVVASFGRALRRELCNSGKIGRTTRTKPRFSSEVARLSSAP